MTTTIRKWGNSHGIRIPKALLDAVQWSDEEQIVLSADKNKIIIEKAEPRKNIVELFADFDGEYVPVEMDWGQPAVVISNNFFNQKTNLAIICPITNTNNKFPLHIPLDNRFSRIFIKNT